ncbi:hypothetical protein [Arthrobacter caoxuetaonis]|uniref:Uncharacterized protein n=1 Tax=Arthrobacter caoxuetaonis TaxID=2886935 RepID=A0A9X1SEA8_9MICC|nr:hypothetical protein [Arthrobacter caoxuetaonis]MCC3299471.1 hypothetical protein [Arthrobacter caoxuetaonis]USQ59037.1 hypothetical protein NF551_18195 [Arthrobacter caoxuetaonis]
MSTDTAKAAGKTNFARVPQGVPAGGQFAATAHAESPLSLALENFAPSETILQQAYKSSRYWADRYGLNRKSNVVEVDDVAQEALVRMFENVSRDVEIKDWKKYMTGMASNVAGSSTETFYRHENRVAYRLFEERCQEIINREQRMPTTAEENAIEKDILDNWHDPRHKPGKNFRIAFTVERSLDATSNEDMSGSFADTLAAVEQTRNVPVDSYMDRAFDALDEKGVASKAKARRLVWNALAEGTGVPLSREGSLSQRHVTRYRAVMNKHEGGIMAACNDWAHGNDNEATEALFAPFGADLDVEGQEKVVDMLERLGAEKALPMWESAISYANNKHAEK